MLIRRVPGVLAALVPLLLGIQFLQPSAPGPVLPGDGTMLDHVAVPGDVDALLRRACYDCHSGETRWPCYSRISPLSWLIAYDVQHWRSNLDFSSWSTHPDLESTPTQRLNGICDDVRQGIMPPRLYRLVHPEARLREADKDLICVWSALARSTRR